MLVVVLELRHPASVMSWGTGSRQPTFPLFILKLQKFGAAERQQKMNFRAAERQQVEA